MAPLSVVATCDCTATSANDLGRYFRARASGISVGAARSRPGRDGKRGRVVARSNWGRRRPARYSRPYGATKDTTCRCYLRGPDGVSRLAPSGTWSALKITEYYGRGYYVSRGRGYYVSRLHIHPQAPRAPELVHLADLAADDEDERRVVDPQNEDHKRRQCARVNRAGIEVPDVDPERDAG